MCNGLNEAQAVLRPSRSSDRLLELLLAEHLCGPAFALAIVDCHHEPSAVPVLDDVVGIEEYINESSR